MKTTITIDMPYNKVGSFRKVNPYTIAYVYSKNIEDNYVIKGGSIDVKNKIRELKLAPCIAHIHYYHHGKSRSLVDVMFSTVAVLSIYISKSPRNVDKQFNKKHWQLLVFKNSRKVLEKRFRRPPRAWLQELNEFI